MRNMRLAKREVKEPEELRQILEHCDVVRIGCQDAEGMFVVPLNYGYEYENGNLKLYIHSSKAGRKADAFGTQAEVAIEIDREMRVIKGDYTCDYSMEYESIMGNGTIVCLDSPAEKERALIILMQHLDPKAKIVFRDQMLDAVNVYCIQVKHFTGKKRETK